MRSVIIKEMKIIFVTVLIVSASYCATLNSKQQALFNDSMRAKLRTTNLGSAILKLAEVHAK
jgi:hypothetical protein